MTSLLVCLSIAQSTEAQLVKGTNELGFKLLARQTQANALLSPISISCALGLAVNGAEGETATEIRAALGSGDVSDTDRNGWYGRVVGRSPSERMFSLRYANGIWATPGFALDHSFRKTSQETFKAKIETTSLHARDAAKRINDWISKSTDGMIPKVIDRLDPRANVVLVNAIHFRADWEGAYEEGPRMPFQAKTGATKPLHFHKDGLGLIAQVGDVIIVRKGYSDPAFEMVFVLPPSNLDDFVSNLNRGQWDRLMDSKASIAEVLAPPWASRKQTSLTPSLREMGIRRALDPDSAELGRLGRGPGRLSISEIAHSAAVTVTRKGTEAGAGTALVGILLGTPKKVVFDRPFLYAIRETKTGLILFLGRVDDPTKP